jgi:hypothetical protein
MTDGSLADEPVETEIVTTEPEAFESDPVLLDSRELAREALLEITDPQTIGADDGHEAHEAHVLTLFFECRLPGYPGWRWAATLSRVDETSSVNVLEAELLPGAGAIVAPEWVPWSVRLSQYRETQARQAAEEAAAAEAAAEELADEDEVDPADDLLENDFSDFDDEIDGVDLDEEADEEDADDIGDADSDDDDDDLDEDDEEDDEDGDEEDDDDDLDDDDDDLDDDDDDLEVDEDGFSDIDEHDLNDLDDDDLASAGLGEGD